MVNYAEENTRCAQNYRATNQGLQMNFMDLAVLALGSMIIVMVFVSKTDLEKSKVPVRIRIKK